MKNGSILILFISMMIFFHNTGFSSEIIKGGHRQAVTSIAFSPDSSMMATSSLDGTIRLWDPQTGQMLNTITPEPTRVNFAAFSPAGGLLAWCSEDHTVKTWDIVENQGKTTMRGHSGPVMQIAFTADGENIFSACIAEESTEDQIKIWHTGTGDCLATLSGHISGARAISYSRATSLVASGGFMQGDIIIRDGVTRKTKARFIGHGTHVLNLDFSPDGRYLASAGGDFMARIWDLKRDNRRRHSFNHPGVVSSVSYSPDGSRLATGCYDQKVRIWDTAHGRERMVLEGHIANIETVSYSPDGKKLASGSFDGMIKIWDPETGDCRITIIP